MAPKKKTKKATKKIQERKVVETDLEAKYRRSVLDVAILQDHIALQSESIQMVQSDRADLRSHTRELEHRLEKEREDHRDVFAEQSRRYKTMEKELTNRVRSLEMEVTQLNEDLARCQEDLRREKDERQQMEQEKDTTLAELRHKLDNMETDYEAVLHDALDSLTSQLSVARQGWEDKSTTLHHGYKGLLSTSVLNTPDI